MQRYTVPYALLNTLTLLECAMSTYVSRIKPKSVSVSNVCNIAFVYFTQRLRETKFCWKSVNPLCCMYFTPAFKLTSRVPLKFNTQHSQVWNQLFILLCASIHCKLLFFFLPGLALLWFDLFLCQLFIDRSIFVLL